MAAFRGRLILTVCLAASSTSVVSAGMTYLLVPLLGDLGITHDEALNALVIPGIGALLLVFVAGVIGSRFGERRTIGVAASTYFAGALLVAIAPNISVVTLGLLIVSCSGITLAIVSLSLLNSRITEPAHRATAFATLGMVVPAVFIAVPILSGAIAQFASWRWIPVLWAALAAFIVLAAVVLLEPMDRSKQRQEFVSPILAGLLLAAGLQVLNNWPTGGLLEFARVDSARGGLCFSRGLPLCKAPRGVTLVDAGSAAIARDFAVARNHDALPVSKHVLLHLAWLAVPVRSQPSTNGGNSHPPTTNVYRWSAVHCWSDGQGVRHLSIWSGDAFRVHHREFHVVDDFTYSSGVDAHARDKCLGGHLLWSLGRVEQRVHEFTSGERIWQHVVLSEGGGRRVFELKCPRDCSFSTCDNQQCPTGATD